MILLDDTSDTMIVAVKPGENILSFFDGVVDSSRYYVIRLKDPHSTRSTTIGID